MASIKRIHKELKEMEKDPPLGCSAAPINKSDMTHWSAVIMSTADSVYHGGVFHLDIRFTSDYPFKPPQIKFLTKIHHCNISCDGSICIDILKGNWSPALTISKVLISLQQLLDSPNPDDPYRGDVASQYKTNRALHDKTAREWVQKYAQSMERPKQ